MQATPLKPFPCPFCHSGRVVLTAGGRTFQHYRCVSCAEVWTAQSLPSREKAETIALESVAPRNRRVH